MAWIIGFRMVSCGKPTDYSALMAPAPLARSPGVGRDR
jgi:hypothetical protein